MKEASEKRNLFGSAFAYSVKKDLVEKRMYSIISGLQHQEHFRQSWGRLVEVDFYRFTVTFSYETQAISFFFFVLSKSLQHSLTKLQQDLLVCAVSNIENGERCVYILCGPTNWHVPCERPLNITAPSLIYMWRFSLSRRCWEFWKHEKRGINIVKSPRCC